MTVIFFIMPVFMYMRFMSHAIMFVGVMEVIMSVPMRMHLFAVQVNVLMLFGAYKPNAGDREDNCRQHHPTYPFVQKCERDYHTDKRGQAKKDACSEISDPRRCLEVLANYWGQIFILEY